MWRLNCLTLAAKALDSQAARNCFPYNANSIARCALHLALALFLLLILQRPASAALITSRFAGVVTNTTPYGDRLLPGVQYIPVGAAIEVIVTYDDMGPSFERVLVRNEGGAAQDLSRFFDRVSVDRGSWGAGYHANASGYLVGGGFGYSSLGTHSLPIELPDDFTVPFSVQIDSLSDPGAWLNQISWYTEERWPSWGWAYDFRLTSITIGLDADVGETYYLENVPAPSTLSLLALTLIALVAMKLGVAIHRPHTKR